MGPSSLTCPHCRRLVSSPGTSADRMPSCPACGQSLVAPTPGAASSPAASGLPPIILTEQDRRQITSPSNPQAAASRSDLGSTPAISAAPRPNRGKSFGLLEVVKIVLGGAAGLGIGYLVVLWIQSRRPPEPTVANSSETGSSDSRTSSGVQFPKFRPPPSVARSPPTPAFTPPPLVGFGTTTPSPIPDERSASETSNSPPAADTQAKSAPQTPPPPMPREPLEGLDDVLKLPALVDTTAASITSLHIPAGSKLDISFNAVAANIPADAAYFVEPQEDGTAPTWLVCYTPNLSGEPDSKRVLAEMTHDQGELKFAWRAPIEDADVRKELLNCLMRLTCDNVSKTALLRAPSDAPRLLLDLTKDVFVHSLPQVDLPKEESVRLEVAALNGFPAGATIKDDKKVLKLRERAVIQFPHHGGAEIHVEFRRQPMTDDLQIVLRPEFRENAAEKVIMTLPRLADMKEAMEKSIPKDEAKVAQLGRELRSLNQQLKDLGPRPGGAAFAVWQSKYTSLSSAISSKNSQVSRLSRRLPELKARLAAVPAMQRFLTEMHQKATLAVRVYSECGDAKIVLIDGRLDPPVQPTGG